MGIMEGLPMKSKGQIESENLAKFKEVEKAINEAIRQYRLSGPKDQPKTKLQIFKTIIDSSRQNMKGE